MTPDHADRRRGEDAIGAAAGRVWLCAQRSPAAQRRGRLVAESLAHPARMLPDLAAHAIAAYSRPGEVVLDPMCGIGTTLVEAVRAGRRAVGIELEPRWVRLAEENLALARAEGHHTDARVVQGDSRGLHHLFTTPPDDDPSGGLSTELGAPSLVLTSPPYGSGVHGQITNRGPGDPIVKYRHRYTQVRTRANLAHTPARLTAGMTAILRAAARVLRPGGHVVIVARPWRERGVLVDLPGQMIACADAAGLVLTDRAVALLARLDDTRTATATGAAVGACGGRARLVARASFFARHNLLRARAAGAPVHLIAHEDVYVFTTPDPTRAPEPGGAPVARPDTARGWSR